MEALGRFEPEAPPPEDSTDAASATAAALATAAAANGGMAIEDESSLENGSIVNMQVRVVGRGYDVFTVTVQARAPKNAGKGTAKHAHHTPRVVVLRRGVLPRVSRKRNDRQHAGWGG